MYDEMTDDDLRAALEERELSTEGERDELVARLELSDIDGAAGDDGSDDDTTPAAEAAAKAEVHAKLTAPPTTQAATPKTGKADAAAVVEAQAKDESGSRKEVQNAVAGTADEAADLDARNGFQTSARVKEGDAPKNRKRIDETFDTPEPRMMGRARTQQDQFDYELLPDGRKRELIFEEPDEDDEDE